MPRSTARLGFNGRPSMRLAREVPGTNSMMRKIASPCSMISQSAAMFGWESADAARASRSSGSRRAGSAAISDGTTLMATVRPRLVSRARNTSPSPPAPIRSRILYWPIVSSIVIPHGAASARDYSGPRPFFISAIAL